MDIILVFNNFFQTDLLYISFFSSIILFFLIYLISLRAFDFFPKINNSNENELKSIKYRGLGILYIIALLPFFYVNASYISIHIIILIISMTFLGFIDDKYDLNPKLKFFIFVIISIIFNVIDIGFQDSFLSFYTFLNFSFMVFFLIFLILFFNQIDGINGLAGLTYVTSVSMICIFFGNSFVFFPFITLVIIYLFFNLRGKVGIQGDSGSYFLGSTFFILTTKYTSDLNIIYSIFFLCPILFDIVTTTLVRLFLKLNILKSHQNNLYQKIAHYYNNHLKSTFCFIFLQIFFSTMVLFLIKIKNEIHIISIGFFIFIIFYYISYLIHKRKILDKKRI